MVFRFWVHPGSAQPVRPALKYVLVVYLRCPVAARGDMYRLREALTAADVRLLIWQLLVATRYLHSCHVWHR